MEQSEKEKGKRTMTYCQYEAQLKIIKQIDSSYLSNIGKP